MPLKSLAVILLATLMLAVGGCAPASAPNMGVDGAHTSQNSLDWAGSYHGILPCADCAGIETLLTLSHDGAYVKSTRYLGKDDKVFTSQGRFSWEANGSTIRLNGNQPSLYRVGENRLVSLALDGSPITGSLAANYVLTKRAPGDITEKYWRLVELHGQPMPKLEREPYFILRAEGGRVTGFGGCNEFTGSYTIDAPALRIGFSQMVSTLRACIKGMDVDQAFTEVLGQVDNYSLQGDSLTLNRARMAPLARFEAVYLR